MLPTPWDRAALRSRVPSDAESYHTSNATSTPNAPQQYLEAPTRSSYMRHTISQSLQEPRSPSWLPPSPPSGRDCPSLTHRQRAATNASLDERGAIWPQDDSGYSVRGMVSSHSAQTQSGWDEYSRSSRASSLSHSSHTPVKLDPEQQELYLRRRADSAASMQERLAIAAAERTALTDQAEWEQVEYNYAPRARARADAGTYQWGNLLPPRSRQTSFHAYGADPTSVGRYDPSGAPSLYPNRSPMAPAEPASQMSRSPVPDKPAATRNQCELCGAKSSLLTILYPCEHRACSFCMSSGLNQVSTSPPRPHACSACGARVEDIGIDKEGLTLSNWAQNLASTPSTPSGKVSHAHSASDDQSTDKSSLVSPDLSLDSGSARLVSNGGTLNAQLHTPRTSDGIQPDTKTLASQYNVKNIESLVSEMKLVPHGVQDGSSSPHHTDEADEEPCTLATLSVVRVDNIPWTTTIASVLSWIPEELGVLPPATLVVQPVHIPIDVANGKTSNACFIECATRRAAMRLIRHRNNSRLCGRPVSLIHSKYQDLLNEIFPARVQTSSLALGGVLSDTRPGQPAFDAKTSRFFTPKHLDHLTNLARYSSQQLKDPVMPIEYITSMLCLLPSCLSADQASLLTNAVQCTYHASYAFWLFSDSIYRSMRSGYPLFRPSVRLSACTDLETTNNH